MAIFFLLFRKLQTATDKINDKVDNQVRNVLSNMMWLRFPLGYQKLMLSLLNFLPGLQIRETKINVGKAEMKQGDLVAMLYEQSGETWLCPYASIRNPAACCRGGPALAYQLLTLEHKNRKETALNKTAGSVERKIVVPWKLYQNPWGSAWLQYRFDEKRVPTS